MTLFNDTWYKFQHHRLEKLPTLQKLWGFFGVQISYVYVVGGLILLLHPSTRIMAVLAGIAFVIARGVVVEIVLHLFPGDRPYQKFGFTPQGGKALFTRVNNVHDSFPSGHAASLAAISFVFYAYYPWLGLLSALLTLLSCYARLLFGYHWPKDIIAGLIIGTITGFGIYIITPYLLPYFALLR